MNIMYVFAVGTIALVVLVSVLGTRRWLQPVISRTEEQREGFRLQVADRDEEIRRLRVENDRLRTELQMLTRPYPGIGRCNR